MNRTAALVVAVWGGFLATLTYWIYAGFTLGDAGICVAESDSHCAREWISALSGWAAASAAGVTIYYLVQQIREATRQTDFVVGMSLPTAAIYDPRTTGQHNAFSNRLEVVNWNRNPILIQAIRGIYAGQLDYYGVEIEDHDAVRKTQLAAELGRNRMRIPGWIDRARAPTFAEFNIDIVAAAAEIPGEIINGLGRVPLLIEVDLVITGEAYRQVTIQASRPDALVLSS